MDQCSVSYSMNIIYIVYAGKPSVLTYWADIIVRDWLWTPLLKCDLLQHSESVERMLHQGTDKSSETHNATEKVKMKQQKGVTLKGDNSRQESLIIHSGMEIKQRTRYHPRKKNMDSPIQKCVNPWSSTFSELCIAIENGICVRFTDIWFSKASNQFLTWFNLTLLILLSLS